MANSPKIGKPGRCLTACSLMPGFFVLIFVSIWFTFMSAMPNVVATLRAVEPVHRSLALGIESIILRYVKCARTRFRCTQLVVHWNSAETLLKLCWDPNETLLRLIDTLLRQIDILLRLITRCKVLLRLYWDAAVLFLRSSWDLIRCCWDSVETLLRLLRLCWDCWHSADTLLYTEALLRLLRLY